WLRITSTPTGVTIHRTFGEWRSGTGERCQNGFFLNWDLSQQLSGTLAARGRPEMVLDRHKLHADLNSIVLTRCDRHVALKRVAVILRTSGNYRWVGLYDVDRAAGQVAIIVWSGPSAPEYPVFPTTKGLTGTAIAERKTVNVGHVNTDPRYL